MRGRSVAMRGSLAWIVTIGLAVGATGPAQAGPITSTDFYREVPADLAPYAPGQVIRWEPETDLGPKFVDLSAYRVMYRSDGFDGSATAEVAMVYIPDGTAPTGGWPLVVWAHGTSGVGDSCAPSLYPTLYPSPWPQYGNEVARLVRQGYVVAAPDYEGLGTPGPHPYLQTDTQAFATIDAARAARELAADVAGTEVGTRWAAIGHSQGGQAAVGAAELATSRAPELQMVGAVALAPSAMLKRLMAPIANDPYGFPYVGYVAAGIAATHPGFDYAKFVGPQLLPFMAYAEQWCFDNWFPITQAYLRPGARRNLATGWGADPDVKDYFRDAQIGTRHADVPILYLQGTVDGLYAVAPDQVAQLCDQGDTVHLSAYPGLDHDPIVWKGWPESRAWLADRFAGLPAPDDC